MNRIEFLKSLGLSGAALMAFTCMGGLSACSNSSDDPMPANTNLVLDLNLAENAALRTAGGSRILIQERVVIARVSQNQFVAATQVCSHEGNAAVSFNPNLSSGAGGFQCAVHGAQFTLTGTGLNSFGNRGLRIYPTQFNSQTNSLTINIS
jgi:cytochrome b6-f complex iron-sulfur subunit